jgi:hypothetical protein
MPLYSHRLVRPPRLSRIARSWLLGPRFVPAKAADLENGAALQSPMLGRGRRGGYLRGSW